MTLTGDSAAKLTDALERLDLMAKETGLAIGTDGLQPALVHAGGDGDTLCRVEYDAALGRHVAVAW